jgi:hypothetical protein
MENELIEICPICIENSAEYYTECGHCYCIGCLSRIKKCAMCRKSLLKTQLCIEIKSNTRNRTTDKISQGSSYSRRRLGELSPQLINRRQIIYATDYNILRIMGGMSGLAYSS